MDYFKFNRLYDELQTVLWKETIFENVQYHYCEECLYAIRLDYGTDNERIILIKAKSPDEAISLGVMKLSKR